MRVLVTNDDGIEAPGIAALAAGLAERGHQVTVVAPVGDASGSGTGTGPQRREIIDRFACVRTDLDGIPAFGLEALPALCVTAGVAGAFGEPPEMVFSGINAGRNVGRSVLHSGTVGAALTAAQLGRPSIAVSVQTRRGEPTDYSAAVWLACRLIPLSLGVGATALNCNLPRRRLHELAGVRIATLGSAALVQRAAVVDGYLEMEFARDPLPVLGTDETLTDEGYATVTPIVGVSSAGGISRADVAGGLLGVDAELAEMRRNAKTEVPK